MFGTVFSKALTARTHWVMRRVYGLSGDPGPADDRAWRARTLAASSGAEAGRLDPRLGVCCPHVLVDVAELAVVWQVAFDRMRARLDEMRTPEGIESWLARVASEANRGTGLVYEAFSRNFSNAVDRGLDDIPAELHPVALTFAKAHGYETPEERELTWAAMREDGLCSHGLDEMTCPCGCFEGD